MFFSGSGNQLGAAGLSLDCTRRHLCSFIKHRVPPPSCFLRQISSSVKNGSNPSAPPFALGTERDKVFLLFPFRALCNLPLPLRSSFILVRSAPNLRSAKKVRNSDGGENLPHFHLFPQLPSSSPSPPLSYLTSPQYCLLRVNWVSDYRFIEERGREESSSREKRR